MAPEDLFSDAALLRDCIAEISNPEKWQPSTKEWVDALANTISQVKSSDKADRASIDFQQKLWEKNRVAAVGQGNISIDPAINDPAFREWLAERSMAPLPTSVSERTIFLNELYEELKSRLRTFVPDRTPHLKIYRVLAALYPEAMTTVADRGKLTTLGRFLNADRSLRGAGLHVWIRSRVDLLLGPPDIGPRALATRMVIPWLFYERYCQTDPDRRTKELARSEGPVQLNPLPAVERLRSLNAFPDGFAAILAVLEFIEDGVTLDELLSFLQTLLPDLKQNSLKTISNALRSQFDVIRREGDLYVRSERGENLLASKDPNELGDWLLTRVLGLDHVIAAVRDRGPMLAADLLAILRQANPNVRTNFAPGVLLNWLRLLKVLEPDSSNRLALTEAGRQWADWIKWTPESLPAPANLDALFEEPAEQGPAAMATPELPDIRPIIESVQKAGYVPASRICQLHAGIWSHRRRHFAILTGLSGSGKTLLAREYAMAITGDSGSQRLLTLPVQPGWYDPGALLGYVNPIRDDLYYRPSFLTFLLAAAGDPSRPYVAVLDEMNLSHPEQYMAPLLSAMETGDPIRLHTEDDMLDGVPPVVRYPSNLVLIGTVNMDETTHGLSDKVLDRAFVMEFWDIDLASYPRWRKSKLEPNSEDRVRELLEGLMEVLAPARLHFGWRMVDDVLDYLAQTTAMGEFVSFDQSLDDVVSSKVLPKLRGEDSGRLREALQGCHGVLAKFNLPRARKKIEDLQSDLKTTGSARFWR